MYDIRNLNIWKEQPQKKADTGWRSKDIAELGLSVRSFNCLKRASCHTVGDVVKVMESEKGLLGIRNLGKTSEKEITEKVMSMRDAARGDTAHGDRFLGIA